MNYPRILSFVCLLIGSTTALQAQIHKSVVGDASKRYSAIVGDASKRYSTVVGDASKRYSQVVDDASKRYDSLTIIRTHNLNPVVVTGSGHHQRLKSTATPVRVLSAQEISEQGITTFDQALTRMMPQVSMAPNAMGSQLRLNGLGNKYILILINGQKLSGDISNNVDLNRINMARVKRIEVLDGAASSLYGSDAIAGVINIITDQPTSSVCRVSNATNISGHGVLTEAATLDIYKNGFGSYTSFTHDRADSYRNNDLEYVKGSDTETQQSIAPLFTGYRSNLFGQKFTYSSNQHLALNAGLDYSYKITDRPNTATVPDASPSGKAPVGGLDYEMRYKGFRWNVGGIYKFTAKNSLQADFTVDRFRYGKEYDVETKTNAIGDYVQSKKQRTMEGSVKAILGSGGQRSSGQRSSGQRSSGQRFQALQSTKNPQSLEASPTKQSLEASPTKQSLEASPTKQSLEASPTKQSLEASPTKQSLEASPTTGTTIIGADWRKDYLTATSGNIDQHVYTLAAYAQHEQLFRMGRGTVTAVLGARYNHHQTFGSHFTPKATLMYSLGPVNVRATYSAGFRAPGLDELYYHYFSVNRGKAQISFGNQSLKPEKSHYLSLNAEYRTQTIAASITGYLNRVNDMVVKQNVEVDDADRNILMQEFPEMTAEQAATLGSVAHYQNSDKGDVKGFQVNLSANLFRGFNLSANYAYTYARALVGEASKLYSSAGVVGEASKLYSSAGVVGEASKLYSSAGVVGEASKLYSNAEVWQPLDRSIRHTATLAANYHHAWGHYALNINLNGRLQSKTYYTGTYENAPGFGIWNLYTTHTFNVQRSIFNSIEPSLGIDNIFDRVDRRIDSSTRKYALYSPGRMLVAGLKVKF